MGKGSTRRPGKGYRDNYDAIDWGSQDTGRDYNYPPLAPVTALLCDARHPHNRMVCTAERYHKGPHAAYGADEQTPLCVWND